MSEHVLTSRLANTVRQQGIVDEDELAWMRGGHRYLRGEPCPPNSWSDAEWRKRLSPGQMEWLGYMLERAIHLQRDMRREDYQRDLKNWAERGAPLPDAPD